MQTQRHYTTRILANPPIARGLWFFAILGMLLLIVGVGGAFLTAIRSARGATPPPPIILRATATAVPQPTVAPTAAPAPDIRQLSDGTIVAWNGREWSILRDAPQAQAQVTQAQEQPQVEQTYQSAPDVRQETEQPQVNQDQGDDLSEAGEVDSMRSDNPAARAATDAFIRDIPTAEPALVELCKNDPKAAATIFCGGQ